MVFVGVDGCRAGWVTVALDESGGCEVAVFATLDGCWSRYRSAQLILIDIPIGLRDGGSDERLCDLEARKLLGEPRRRSVFPAPYRPSLSAQSYAEAATITTQVAGKGLQKQGWSIFEKVKEADELLRNETEARLRVREMHPEVCFWAFAGRPMKLRKTRKDGVDERKTVLKSFGFDPDLAIHQVRDLGYRASQVKDDDVLDAAVGGLTAKLGGEHLETVPRKPESDSQGLPMEMVFYRLP